MIEQRKFERITSGGALVELYHPSVGRMELKARDLSEGGVYVFLGQHTALPVGTVVKARIKRHTGAINDEPVDMRIVHHQGGGMGLGFL